MAELTAEQKLQIDLHKSKLARQLIERGMLPSIADRTVEGGHYEFLQTGELRVMHGTKVSGTAVHELNTLATDLQPSSTGGGVDLSIAENAIAHINAERAARPNPLAPRRAS